MVKIKSPNDMFSQMVKDIGLFVQIRFKCFWPDEMYFGLFSDINLKYNKIYMARVKFNV